MSQSNYSFMLPDAPWGGPTAELIDGPDVEFNEGKRQGEVEREFVFDLVVDDKADPAEFQPLDILGPQRHPLFSFRFADLLSETGVDNIEYFDARVKFKPSGESVDYRVANIVGVIDGLDMEKSSVIEDDGIIFGIESIVFAEDQFAGQSIFRLGEDSTLVVVHDGVRRAIEDRGLTGFKFVRDVEWMPGMV